MLNDIRSLLPLTESESDTFFHRIRDTTHATLYGMLALSALQGLLGGLMHFWLGIPSPWFWALLMAAHPFSSNFVRSDWLSLDLQSGTPATA